jgi:hypothetical protein
VGRHLPFSQSTSDTRGLASRFTIQAVVTSSISSGELPELCRSLNKSSSSASPSDPLQSFDSGRINIWSREDRKRERERDTFYSPLQGNDKLPSRTKTQWAARRCTLLTSRVPVQGLHSLHVVVNQRTHAHRSDFVSVEIEF